MKIELSEQAFHLAWQHYGLGPKPLSLNILPSGITEDERRHAEQQGQDELGRLGFGDRDVEDGISGLFYPLNRYSTSFDLVNRHIVDGEQRRRTAFAAVGPASSALAVWESGTVRMIQLRAEELPRSIVGVLSDIQPGPGTAVSVPSQKLDAAAAEAGESNRAMREGLQRLGVRRDEASALVEMAGSRRVSHAQFGASKMDRRGNRTRASMVTNCFATSNGWYLLEEARRTGEAWTTIAPIDRQRMTDRVRSLTKAISPD